MCPKCCLLCCSKGTWCLSYFLWCGRRSFYLIALKILNKTQLKLNPENTGTGLPWKGTCLIKVPEENLSSVLSCMETFPTFVTVVWDLPCWPTVTPGAQGSAVTSGTFYLMHPVARGHILLIMWNWPQLSKPLWPHIRQLKSNPLESTLKTTQVFHMAAVFLLNRSITQAGAHFTSRLIHPVA